LLAYCFTMCHALGTSSSSTRGGAATPQPIRALILQMARENPA
jgi:hypothetical protein